MILLGDGEELLPSFIDALQEVRSESRSVRLRRLAQVPGIYVPSLNDPQEVLACCKGTVEQAGGYKWTFAAPRPKLDAADVQELIDGNYAIQIQQRNPKKAGTKSALLYDQYKGAESIRDMLALGARRADGDHG